MKHARYAHVWLLTGFIAVTAGCGTSARGAAPTPLPVVVDVGGVTAGARLEPLRYVEISPATDGLLSEVLVREGQHVDAGELMARLDGTEMQTLETAQTRAALELSEAYQQVREAQRKLDAFPVPAIFAGLTAEAAARKSLAELDAARIAFAPYKDASRKTLKSRDAFSGWVYPSLPRRVVYDTGEYEGVAAEYEKRVDRTRADYTKAVLWLQLDSDVSLAKARLAEAQRRYDLLEEGAAIEISAGTRAALAPAELRAPFAGTLTNVHLKVGETARAGAPVATLADLSAWMVRTTDLTEMDVVSLEPGMPVSVVLDAMPHLTFHGTVLSVDLSYADRQGDVVYPVQILLTEGDPAMRWGMTAEVTFEE